MGGHVGPPLLLFVMEKHLCVWAYLPPPLVVLLICGKSMADCMLQAEGVGLEVHPCDEIAPCGVVAIVRYWNFVSSTGHIELLALD